MRTYQAGYMKAIAVTPSDTTDLVNGHTKAIFIGTAGTLAVVMSDGGTITFTGLSAGVIHLLSVARIKTTGTTATNIVALY